MLDVLRVKGQNFPYIYQEVDSKREEIKNKRKWKIGVVTSSLWVWDKAENYAPGCAKAVCLDALKIKERRDTGSPTSAGI